MHMRVENTFLTFDEEERRGSSRRTSSVPADARLVMTPASKPKREGDACSVATNGSGSASPALSWVDETESGDDLSLLDSPSLSPTDSPRGPVEGCSPVLQKLLERPEAGNTTVMVRNIPNKYTQRMLLKIFKQEVGEGFRRSIDLFYLPIDFKNKTNLGYCFVNFATEENAALFRAAVNGLSLSLFKSTKILTTDPARVQGFEANFTNFRNSAVMGKSVAPEYQPVIFDPETGVEVPFPGGQGSLKSTKKAATKKTVAKKAAPVDIDVLGKRLFTKVRFCVDEFMARMIVGGTMEAYKAQGQIAELEALVTSVEIDAMKLQQVVTHGMNQLAAAGYLVPAY